MKLAPQIFLFDKGESPHALPPSCIGLPQVHCGDVFGDGSHPTTRLVAGALDYLCRAEKPTSVLDVGTGTGVLARIARARGVSDVVGTDIDLKAIACAKANADLDRSPHQILFTDVPPDHFGPRFDLIVANILEAPLITLAPAFSRALTSDGLVLISGFTRLQVPKLQLAFTGRGLVCVTESHLESWAALLFRAR